MLNQADIHKIERYIKGESNEEEIVEVESMFHYGGETNQKLKSILRQVWENILKENSVNEDDLSNLLHKIHHRLHKKEYELRNKSIRRIIQIYMKVAAVLLLPIIVAGSIFLFIVDGGSSFSSKNKVTSTIYAPMGSRVSFMLPDSTTGMLNSGSFLTYSLPFERNREVSLEGEAWFEVTRNEENPFRINTGNYSVNVLGTSLNVSAYPSQKYIEVVLKKGKIEFVDNSTSLTMQMLPSEKLVFRNGNIKKVTVDPDKYIAWTQGKLIFKGDPMSEVVNRIERWYNVKIILADKELETYSFRGTFEDDSLEEVLSVLAMTSPIKYKVSPRKLLPDGNYKKEEVTIYKKHL